MQPKYGSKLQLCYMDTDSFVYHIRTEDFYRDIADDVEARFDTSAYSKDDNRPLPIGKNKKVVGLMKDELAGKVMTEFITLRAKLYAYESLTKEGGDRKAKGVKKCVTKKSITFDDYQQCLEQGVDIYKKQVLIQNKGHKIYTQEVNKLALNRADDKRIVQPDQITTLARGYRGIKCVCTLVAIILPYAMIAFCFLRYRRIIKRMSDIAQVFDNASAEYENIEKPIDKRQMLKEALRKGKGHLLPNKCCTEDLVDKASNEAIDKVHTEYLQLELHEKGERTARALSTHVISLYAGMIGNFVDIDNVDELRRDIEEDPIIRDSMTDLGILVYCTIGRCLAPLLVAGHTARHMKKKNEVEEDKEEPQAVL